VALDTRETNYNRIGSNGAGVHENIPGPRHGVINSVPTDTHVNIREPQTIFAQLLY